MTDMLSFLFSHAEDDESAALTRLLIRVGYLWRCDVCDWQNVHDDDWCDNCGKERA